MSEPLAQRSVRYDGVLETSGYLLKIYRVDFDGQGVDISEHLEKCFEILKTEGEDPEFQLHRKGFLIAHNGRRGTTFMLYHFGLWVDMPEVFHVSWYLYRLEESDGQQPELLDYKEPMASFHDLPTIASELFLWRKLLLNYNSLQELDWAQLYDEYFSGPAPHG